MSDKNGTTQQTAQHQGGATAPPAPPLEFHPLANQYALLPGEELLPIVESMQEHGYQADKPITLYEGKILDGRNRYRAACQAGLEPTWQDFSGGPDEARAFVARENELRRHDSQEVIRKRREERVAEVGRLRSQRRSSREIARKLGVSQSQVQRDWATFQGQVNRGGSPEPESPSTVVGRDGKEYPATQPRPPQPAPAPPPDREPGDDTDEIERERAEEANGVPPTATATKRKPAREKQEEVADSLGAIVPPRLRDVFADDAVPGEAARIREWMEAVKFKAVSLAITRRQEAYPFVVAVTVERHLEEAYDSLRAAAEYIEQNLPYAVCPACDGDGKCSRAQCKECRAGCGYVPLWRFNELKVEGKA